MGTRGQMERRRMMMKRTRKSVGSTRRRGELVVLNFCFVVPSIAGGCVYHHLYEFFFSV